MYTFSDFKGRINVCDFKIMGITEVKPKHQRFPCKQLCRNLAAHIEEVATTLTLRTLDMVSTQTKVERHCTGDEGTGQ